MAGRIVLFGATGYTGELTARELAGRGERPVLAARDEARVRALADELGGLEWAVADVRRPEPACARWSGAATCWSPPWGRSPLGRAGGGGGDRRGRALPGLDRRDALHPRGLRGVGAARGGRGRRRCSPRWATTGSRATSRARWRCASRARGACASTSATSLRRRRWPRRDERRDARLGRGRDARAGLRLPRRPPGHRAQWRAGRSFSVGGRARKASRPAPPSTSRCRARSPSCATSTSTSAGSAARRMRCGLLSPAPRWSRRCRGCARCWASRRPGRQGLHRRARRRGARRSSSLVVAEARDAARPRAGGAWSWRAERLRLHGRDDRLGGARGGGGTVAGQGALGPGGGLRAGRARGVRARAGSPAGHDRVPRRARDAPAGSGHRPIRVQIPTSFFGGRR